jgi:tetratricopeptide (TPR) repeat protein
VRRTVTLVVIVLILMAAALQWGVDRTPAGAGEEKREDFPAVSGLLDFLGGIRQYLAYTFYIKSDKLHHSYYGSFGSEAELIPYYILISWLDPYYVSAYLEGSETIYQQGEEEEAIAFLKQGISANPESADLHVALADFYLREGRYQESRDEFESALEGDQGIFTRYMILRDLAAIYHLLGEGQRAKEILLEMTIYEDVKRYTRELDYEQVKESVKRINNIMNEAFPQETNME